MGKIHFSTNKEVFDAEVYPIDEALSIPLKYGQTELGRASQETTLRWFRI